ncbi:hypothetical protein PBI_NILO_82 [Mycobacterium phage Nilo]|uniref:Uncharacterized protein n=1 Tax=Mycobacterium phage Nilo TaxID=2108129 RepID=A0A2P1JQP4_9CAUD|nr:hypothetical protein PBI_NILO_82 [Mycobacterium phage Nilo]
MSEQEKTAEQLEAEAAEMLAKVAALKAKKRAKTGKAPVREGDTLRRIQQDQTVKSATLAKEFRWLRWPHTNQQDRRADGPAPESHGVHRSQNRRN